MKGLLFKSFLPMQNPLNLWIRIPSIVCDWTRQYVSISSTIIKINALPIFYIILYGIHIIPSLRAECLELIIKHIVFLNLNQPIIQPNGECCCDWFWNITIYSGFQPLSDQALDRPLAIFFTIENKRPQLSGFSRDKSFATSPLISLDFSPAQVGAGFLHYVAS